MIEISTLLSEDVIFSVLFGNYKYVFFPLVPATLRNLKITPRITKFEEIDVSKALTSPARLLYPKIAKRSRLDDLLSRRAQLKLLEERRIAQQSKTDEQPANEDENVDVENDEIDLLETESGLDKQLSNMMSGKVVPNVANTPQTQALSKEVLNNIAKKIQALRLHYTAISKLAKDFQCYSRGCNSNSTNLVSSCYSPLCMQRNKVRHDLLVLLRKANVHTNANASKIIAANALGSANTPANSSANPSANTSANSAANVSGAKKTTSILEQKLTAPQQVERPTEANLCKDLASAILAAPKFGEETEMVYVPVEVKEEVKKEEVKVKTEDEPPSKKVKVDGESSGGSGDVKEEKSKWID